MTWLRSLWLRFRYRKLRDESLVAIELRVYKVRQGCLLLAASESGTMSLILDKPRALALIDTILDTIDEPEAAPVAS